MDDDGPGFTIELSDSAFEAVLIGTIVAAFAAVVVVTLVRLVRTWQPAHRMRAIDKLSRSTNLVIPEELREPLAHAVAVRRRGAEIGSLAGLFGALVLLRPWEGGQPPLGLAGTLIGIAVLLAGQTAGAVAGGLFARRSAATSHRAARLTGLPYSDLLAPVERRLVAVCAIVGVAIPALLAALAPAPWVDRDLITTGEALPLLLGGVLSGALALLLPRIGRRLASVRAIAGDEHALAWSDALASRTVRDMAYLLATVSGLAAITAVIWLGSILPQQWQTAADVWANLGFYIVMAGIITAIVVVATRNPERHVQRTLWPQFARDAQ